MITLAADREIEGLLALHPKGYDLSLERVTRLLERLGDPQDQLPPVIHIAGTNGKGSCAAFSRALLEAADYRVHTHTSPHLVHWHERYRLAAKGGGRLVEDKVLAEAVARVAEANGGQTITVFEILTAVTFLLFSEHPADAAILEVGLGGRFDATNVVKKPAVSVIMPVSLDHQAFLGDRVELIAAEKAGIIKRGCPVVIGAQDEDGLMDLPLPRLTGRHQFANAAAAIAAVKTAGFEISHRAAEKAMTTADWPGRMQKLTQGRLVDLAPRGADIWLDGGHNPGASVVIAEAMAEQEEKNPRPLFLIAGMINTKDQHGYFSAFKGLVRHVYTVPGSFSDAGVSNDELAARANEAGLSAEPVNSVAAALALLRDTWDASEPPPRVLIGGSLYLAGAVLAENGTPPV